MSTIINTPSPERIVEVDRTDGTAGWAIAVLILLVVIGGGLYTWMHYYRGTAAPSGGTNINVTLPANPAATTP